MRDRTDRDHNSQSNGASGGTTENVFDLRLPHLNISQSSTNGSTKDEKLAQGLFGHLRFEKWDNFETLMDTTLASISEVQDFFTNEAQKKFEECHKGVNETYSSTKGEKLDMKDSFPICYARTPLYEGVDPRKHFDTSTSVDVEGYLFNGLKLLLNGIFVPEYVFEVPVRQFHLLGIPRLPGRRGRIPDRALCTVTMSKPDAPPVCTFEMKGPAESFAHLVESCCHRLLETASSCSSERKSEIVREVLSGPQCLHELSAAALCLYFNSVFAKRPENGENEADITKKITMMIAQTLVQALTTSSGCGFFFTYEIGENVS